jgi:hypothetical protein
VSDDRDTLALVRTFLLRAPLTSDIRSIAVDGSGNVYAAIRDTSKSLIVTPVVYGTPVRPSPQPPALNVPSLLALFISMLGGVETVNVNGTETITDSLFGMTLLVSTYDGSGNFVSAALMVFTLPNWFWFM